MPEVLGGSGELFDPERVDSVADALRRLSRDPELRRARSEAAFARARDFTWSRCAADTLAFVTSVGAAAMLQDLSLRGERVGSAREPQAGSGLS